MRMDLTMLRQEIDGIDEQLTRLLVQRMHICGEVAQYKKANALPVFHPEREQEVLARISAVAGEDMEAYARAMFGLLFSLSRDYQEKVISAGDGEA